MPEDVRRIDAGGDPSVERSALRKKVSGEHRPVATSDEEGCRDEKTRK